MAGAVDELIHSVPDMTRELLEWGDDDKPIPWLESPAAPFPFARPKKMTVRDALFFRTGV